MGPVTATGRPDVWWSVAAPTNALRHYNIGHEEIYDGLWPICFGSILFARVDERGDIIGDDPQHLQSSVTHVPDYSLLRGAVSTHRAG